ncbi:MAG: hypothetical protein KGL39_07630 [Patescibacteria group bacterium]|nr:hypothetical protein [Patescibacteria group bacterium]
MARMVEVDEADLLRSRQLAEAIQKINAHPEGRKLLAKAQKTAFPEMPIPEDYQDEVLRVVQEEREARLALEKKIAEEAAAREAAEKQREFVSAWQRQQNAVRERYPELNEEAIKAIETMASERGIPDFEAAAALWVRDHPPATPATPSGFGAFNLFDQPAPEDDRAKYMDELMKSPDGTNDAATDRYVRKILSEQQAPAGRRAA